MPKRKLPNQTNTPAKNNRGKSVESTLWKEVCSLWLGMRDSNPRSWNQNPLPYHLANPQYLYSLPLLSFESKDSVTFSDPGSSL
jgi:hypothetical protein